MIPGETLIFLDEVQECKELVTAIKFLVDEGMKKTIDRLSMQVKTFKRKVKQYEAFLDLRGLVDAFVEYVRPKTVQEQLVEKKAIVEKKKKIRVQEVDVKKKHDIAI